jgi:hypothetical protein
MGSPDPTKARLVAGKLAHTCSSLALPWPHGGVGLGLIGGIYVAPQRSWKALDQEESNSASEVLWLGGDLVVGITARGWENDALAFLFGTTALSNSHRVISWPHAAGQPATTYTNVVFTPNNPLHPGVVVYKAAPLPDVNQDMFLSAYRYLEVPAVLIALPDGSDRLGKMGKFSELTL